MSMSIDQLSRLGRRLMAGWRSLRADERGNAAIITAMSALPLMGLAGLATDSAVWEINKRNMQGAADQAALAAVVAYQAGGGSDPASTAKGVASQFGFTDGVNGASVTVTNVNPSPTGYDAAYTVAISQPQAQYFSASFLSAPTASAKAMAGATSNGPCVLALNPTPPPPSSAAAALE
jgi:Flp pilus assembly protein TadG